MHLQPKMTPEDIKHLFPDLRRAAGRDLERFLSTVSECEITAGNDLICRGVESDALYLIHHGLVRVSLESADECAVLNDYGPGQWIGEMGMIEPAIAVARATAIRDCRALRLSHNDFMALRRRCPTLTSILLQLFSDDLSKRLRATIQFIDGGEQNLGEEEGHSWYAECAKRVLGVAARIGA